MTGLEHALNSKTTTCLGWCSAALFYNGFEDNQVLWCCSEWSAFCHIKVYQHYGAKHLNSSKDKISVIFQFSEMKKYAAKYQTCMVLPAANYSNKFSIAEFVLECFFKQFKFFPTVSFNKKSVLSGPFLVNEAWSFLNLGLIDNTKKFLVDKTFEVFI